MGDRSILAQRLVDLMEGNKVYYQPPESVKLIYPCLIYNLQAIDTDNANDKKYLKNKRYSMVFISRIADDPLIDKILELPYCEHKDRYVMNNLYHDAFILYY